jgi:DNA-binding response OmpR family regulator
MGRVVAFGDCAPLTDRLRASGHEILRAPGKSRALGLARDLVPDLVLVGTGEDGQVATSLVQQLTGDPLVQLLPVLVLLRGHDPQLVKTGLEAGATDVLDAGMDAAELEARTAAALRSKKQLEQLVAEKQRLTLLELAGAVAHKINQPLTSMSIIVETLLASHARSDLSPDRLAQRLQELQRLIDRMASIVKQVASIVDYRTVDYVGEVKIIDLDPTERPER